jgi:hypothetical protein
VGAHLLLLGPLLVVASVTIVEDVRTGRIANTRLLQGLALGAACYALLLLGELSGLEPPLAATPIPVEGWHWSSGLAANLGVGLAVAVLLWLLGVWAAGDAKLFVVYAVLVPPSCYVRSYLPGFPALPLLVNVFALVFVFLAVDLLRTGVPALVSAGRDPGRRRAALREAPVAGARLVPMLLLFTAMFAGMRAVREAAREGLEPILELGDFTLFLILFAAFRPLAKLVLTRGGAVVFTSVSGAALVWLGTRHGLAALPGVIVPGAMAVTLILFSRAYVAWGSATRQVRVGDLRPGAVLGHESLLLLQAREQRELADLGDDAPAPDEERPNSTARPTRIGSLSADGLTAEQVRFVRTRYNDDEAVLVQRTLPFSPFLAGGALITFAWGGALVSLLTGR